MAEWLASEMLDALLADKYGGWGRLPRQQLEDLCLRLAEVTNDAVVRCSEIGLDLEDVLAIEHWSSESQCEEAHEAQQGYDKALKTVEDVEARERQLHKIVERQGILLRRARESLVQLREEVAEYARVEPWRNLRV